MSLFNREVWWSLRSVQAQSFTLPSIFSPKRICNNFTIFSFSLYFFLCSRFHKKRRKWLCFIYLFKPSYPHVDARTQTWGKISNLESYISKSFFVSWDRVLWLVKSRKDSSTLLFEEKLGSELRRECLLCKFPFDNRKLSKRLRFFFWMRWWEEFSFYIMKLTFLQKVFYYCSLPLCHVLVSYKSKKLNKWL